MVRVVARDCTTVHTQKEKSREFQRFLHCHSRPFTGIGAGEEIRTPDLRITNALLYQLSYTGTYFTFSPSEELAFPDRDAHYGELPKKMQVLKRYFLLVSSLLFDPSRKTLPPLPPIRPSSSPANLQP